MKNEQAIIHFNNKVLLTSQSYLDVKGYEHALAFTVAKMLDEDLLKDTKDLIGKSLENGTSFREFKKQLKPLLLKKGWLGFDDSLTEQKDINEQNRKINRRLRTVYHTNLHTAYSAGQWQRIQKTKEFLPYLQYMPSLSENKRLEHKQYYNIIRPVDDPIWQSIMPPNGYGCRCWVKQITKTKANKIGISDPVKLEMETVKNPKTGEMVQTPVGVHFSFNHNHDRLTALLKLAEDKHGTEFGERLRKEVLNDMLTSFAQSITVVEFMQAMGRDGFNRRIKSSFYHNEVIAKQAESLGLSREELFSIMGYTDGHGAVQDFLRDFDKFMTGFLRSRVRITAKQIQYMLQGLQKLPNYVGEVIRRVNNYAQLKDIKIGDIIVERGFSSSSISDNPKNDTFKSRRIRLIIQSKTGKKIDWLAYYPAQKEVIFVPNTRFEVTNIQNIENEIWINLTEIL